MTAATKVRSRIEVVLFLVFVGLNTTVAVGEETKTLPPSVQQAVKEYQADVAVAEAKFGAEAEKARQSFLAKLNEEMKKETMAGNLDNAVAIRDEIRRIQSESPSAKGTLQHGQTPKSTAALPPQLIGKWIVKYQPPFIHTYTVHPDGTCSYLEKGVVGNLKRQSNDTFLITFAVDDGDFTERWTLAGNRFFVEHFYPVGSFPKATPTFLGVGEKAK